MSNLLNKSNDIFVLIFGPKLNIWNNIHTLNSKMKTQKFWYWHFKNWWNGGDIFKMPCWSEHAKIYIMLLKKQILVLLRAKLGVVCQ